MGSFRHGPDLLIAPTILRLLLRPHEYVQAKFGVNCSPRSLACIFFHLGGSPKRRTNSHLFLFCFFLSFFYSLYTFCSHLLLQHKHTKDTKPHFIPRAVSQYTKSTMFKSVIFAAAASALASSSLVAAQQPDEVNYNTTTMTSMVFENPTSGSEWAYSEDQIITWSPPAVSDPQNISLLIVNVYNYSML